MRFEWDETKNDANRRKHGLSFETACRVFEDPLILSQLERVVDGEQRWQTIGEVAGVALVLVAHTVREGQDEEVIRIISARRATRHERKQYQQT
ncbi:BrnT family toxin [Salinisphaera hydrothermalis]|uniref:BrnT family toxin n=1 Tax=Salinisphaera hydrothermalis TaxID=563188 RepID=UPI0033423380